MAEIILTGKAIDLPAIIGLLTVPADAWMFLERVPQQRLNTAELAEGIKMTAYDPTLNPLLWERGRIFCRNWELRWESGQAVYTGAQTALPGFVANLDLSACARQPARYYLWGTRDGQRFIELQIARALRYPFANGTNGQRIKLVVAEWFDSAGQLTASRFVELEAA